MSRENLCDLDVGRENLMEGEREKWDKKEITKTEPLYGNLTSETEQD